MMWRLFEIPVTLPEYRRGRASHGRACSSLSQRYLGRSFQQIHKICHTIRETGLTKWSQQSRKGLLMHYVAITKPLAGEGRISPCRNKVTRTTRRSVESILNPVNNTMCMSIPMPMHSHPLTPFFEIGGGSRPWILHSAPLHPPYICTKGDKRGGKVLRKRTCQNF